MESGEADDSINRRAWQDTLDAMERDLEYISETICAGGEIEALPRRTTTELHDMEPLPDDMVDQVLDLVNRQADVSAQIRETMLDTAQKIRAIRATRIHAAGLPHYVDQEG
jgi:hypothetical protein